MIQSTIGSLSIIFNNEDSPLVYWKGIRVIGVIAILVNSGDGDERIVRFKINNPLDTQLDILNEMTAAGILIKKVRN